MKENYNLKEVLIKYSDIGLTKMQIDSISRYLLNDLSDSELVSIIQPAQKSQQDALKYKNTIDSIMNYSNTHLQRQAVKAERESGSFIMNCSKIHYENFHKNAFILFQLFGESFFDIYSIFNSSVIHPLFKILFGNRIEKRYVKRIAEGMRKLTFYSTYCPIEAGKVEEDMMIKPLIQVGFIEYGTSEELVLCRALDLDGEITLQEGENDMIKFINNLKEHNSLKYITLGSSILTEIEKKVVDNILRLRIGED